MAAWTHRRWGGNFSLRVDKSNPPYEGQTYIHIGHTSGKADDGFRCFMLIYYAGPQYKVQGGLWVIHGRACEWEDVFLSDQDVQRSVRPGHGQLKSPSGLVGRFGLGTLICDPRIHFRTLHVPRCCRASTLVFGKNFQKSQCEAF